MDTSTLDRIARLLGSAATRRAGLGFVAAGVLGRAGLEVAAAKPKPSGPCKSTRRKDNLCDTDSECCTGICETGTGKKNKDGRGRCRCRRVGQPCTADRNCCTRRKNPLSCVDNVCGYPQTCTPLGTACDATTTCCAGACGGPPAGTAASRSNGPITCCLAIGSSGCTTDADCCGGAVTAGSRISATAACENGVCVAACLPLQAVCTPGVDVCCAGSCGSQGFGFDEVAGPVTVCCIPDYGFGCVTTADCCTNGFFCSSQGKCDFE